jgi:hypothetical protein
MERKGLKLLPLIINAFNHSQSFLFLSKKRLWHSTFAIEFNMPNIPFIDRETLVRKNLVKKQGCFSTR